MKEYFFSVSGNVHSLGFISLKLKLPSLYNVSEWIFMYGANSLDMKYLLILVTLNNPYFHHH